MRLLFLIVLLGAAFSAQARSCFLTPTGALSVAEEFEFSSCSDDGFFCVFWNGSGESVSSSEQVQAVLEAATAARSAYEAFPGAWQVPLGERLSYPIYLVRQGFPGGTMILGNGLSEMYVASNMADFGGDPLSVTRVTVAHELFHAFQLAALSDGIDERDRAFLEASAVWAEDYTYPDLDDWVTRYAPAFLEDLDRPLSSTDGTREYGAAMVVKHALCRWADTTPLLNTFLELDGEHRAWSVFLNQSGDAADTYAAAMCEILQSGIPIPAGADPCITELAAFPEVGTELIPALLPATGGASQGTLQELSCVARRLPAAGTYSLEATIQALPGCIRLMRYGSYQPETLQIGDTLQLAARDYILFCNASSVYASWSLAWEQIVFSTEAIVALWPNPGARVRSLRLSRPVENLSVFNLAGQALATLPLEGHDGVHVIQLPATAAGIVFLKAEGQTVPLCIQ